MGNLFNRRVLVTGGCGFIGSHLSERLIDAGSEVLCVDNFYTGSPGNVATLMSHPKFEMLKHDITTPLYADVDRIFNLACPASPVHYQRDPIKTTTTSVLGAINVLDLARARKATVLQASTSEVYGDPLVHPQTEDYWGNVNPNGLRSCYDEGKRCAEALFFDYWRQHKVGIKVARIFNTYGPRMHPNDGRVVSSFIVQALLGTDIPVNGDGSQTRSFCYVADTVEALVCLMESPTEIIGPINIGNPHEISIRDLATRIIDLTGSRSRLVYRQLPQDDPCRRKPDVSRARDQLGWLPQVGLDDGLLTTINYFDGLLGRSGSRRSAGVRLEVGVG